MGTSKAKPGKKPTASIRGKVISKIRAKHGAGANWPEVFRRLDASKKGKR